MQHEHAREHATVIGIFLPGHINLYLFPFSCIEFHTYQCWFCKMHQNIHQAVKFLFVVFWNGIQETNFMLPETDDSSKPVYWRVNKEEKVLHSEHTVYNNGFELSTSLFVLKLLQRLKEELIL